MKITTETNKKYCTGLLADSPTVERCGEEEANGEHYMEQSTPLSAKPHKTQSRRKSKPYKVEIRSSISTEYFVDNEDDAGSETPTSSRGRKIKRKTPLSQETAESALKKCYTESSGVSESPSGVGIFSFEMPTEFHSNLHQLAMASQLVSQSPSGEVPHSVIRAIEHEQKSQQEHQKSLVSNREKPKSLVLSIPRSPLISISGKQSTTTPASSLVHQSTMESATPSCTATAIPSPVIVSNRNGKTTSPLENSINSSATPATQVVPESPDSEESVFTYPNAANNSVGTSQLKSTSTPTIVRVDSVESDVPFSSCVAPVMSNEAITKTSEPLIVTNASSKHPGTTPLSAHPTVTTPVTVTQNGAFFECPPPVSVVTKPTSIQVCSLLGGMYIY